MTFAVENSDRPSVPLTQADLCAFRWTHGEGNGNPLQYSCLENPRDRGAWWTAVYGVTQSRIRLKRLSSSISSRWTQTHCVSYRDYQFSTTLPLLILLSEGAPLSLELAMYQLKGVFSTLWVTDLIWSDQVKVDLILANEMSIGVVQRNFYEYQKWESAWELLSTLLSFFTLLTSNLNVKTGASAARLHHEAITWEDFWAKCGKE